MSSNHAIAFGSMSSIKAANEIAESWRSSFGTSHRVASFLASRTTRPNAASDSPSVAPSSVQAAVTPPNTVEA